MTTRLHDLVQKLVASDNPNEAYTTFTGVTRLRQGISPQNVFVDRNEEDGGLARAATLGATLSRAKTTLNVPGNARERLMDESAGVGASQSPPPRSDDPLAATPLTRSNTAMTTGRPGQAGFPTRGLSVRSRPGSDEAGIATSPKMSA
jgi:hypothetical protein